MRGGLPNARPPAGQHPDWLGTAVQRCLSSVLRHRSRRGSRSGLGDGDTSSTAPGRQFPLERNRSFGSATWAARCAKVSGASSRCRPWAF